jgi:hypothetical protein
MRLRLFPVMLACAALASGFATVSAQASPVRAGKPGDATPADATPARVASGGPASALRHAGAITGIVAGTGHVPLAGACVVASGPSGAAMDMTGRDGRYSINPLRPGKYTLHYSDCSAPARYLDQWSGGGFSSAGAARVAVAAGQVRRVARVTLHSTASILGVDGARAAAILGIGAGVSQRTALVADVRRATAGTAVVAAGTGAIAGKVTGRGEPLKGICVVAFPTRSGRSARVETSKSGRYRIGSLQPGLYFVAFFNCSRTSNWLSQWYRGVPFINATHRRTKVPVTVGKTTRDINAALRLGGEIDGTVRSKSGKALPKICVEAIGRAGRRFLFGGFTRSDDNGRYSLHALAPGSYQIRFSLGCGNKGNYAPLWWRNSLTFDHATKIAITYGTIVRHIDPALPRGGAVTGVVRAAGPSGKRLSRICVFARGLTRDSTYAFTVTASDGSYRLVGLTTGKYQISYSRCGNRGNYLPARRSVRVRLGHTVSGFDVFLPLGAIAKGVVTDTHGNPVAGICVELRGRRQFGGARTGSDGSYAINAMPTGSYTVQFEGGCGNAGSYAPQFYRGQTNAATADPVRLTAGQTTPRINATMQPGATIRGAVTDSAGSVLNDVCISISPVLNSQFNSFFFFRSHIAFARNGAYSAANLAPGLYVVNFGCFFGTRTLARQWFMAQPDASTANPVSAPAGVITSGVSATLQPSGTIAGTVTNRDGKPLPSICVRARLRGTPSEGRFFGPGASVTGRRGTYILRGLPAGDYVVQFIDCGRASYGSRWYQHKPSAQAATPVTVTPGGATTGIDEKLAPGGSISGRVRTSAGTPLAGVCVQADDATRESEGFGRTDSTGHYSIIALSTGSYQITFIPCRFRSSLARAVRPALVPVTAPNAVTGINAVLGPAGSISGTVGDSAARPQAGACVVAVPVDPDDTVGAALTGRHGNYQIGGLGAGTYHVQFGDPFCISSATGTPLAPRWYNDQATQATATDVTVSAGAHTSGIDANLGLDGGISGVVSHLGTPVAGECVTAFPVDPTPDPLFGQTLRPVIGVSASDGSYSLVDLLPGQYRVKFSVGCGDSGFATQWWNDATSEGSATIVTVAANGTVTGIDASLP